jgi:hypothetical protein
MRPFGGCRLKGCAITYNITAVSEAGMSPKAGHMNQPEKSANPVEEGYEIAVR